MSSARLEGDVLLNGGANPEIALFKSRHEFAADELKENDGADERGKSADPRNFSEAQNAAQSGVVVAAEKGAQPGFRGGVLLWLFGSDQRAQHRSKDEREDQRAGERES